MSPLSQMLQSAAGRPWVLVGALSSLAAFACTPVSADVAAISPASSPSILAVGNNQPGAFVNMPVAAAQPMVPADVPAANPPAMPQGPALIDLDFEDVPVDKLIDMIAKQGNVQIVMVGDVGGLLRAVHLNEISPEDAIKEVADDAGLTWREDGVRYLIGKNLPTPAVSVDPSIPSIVSGLGGQPMARTGDSRPIVSDALPELVPTSMSPASDGHKEYRVLRLKNVAPHLVAYWVDPEHNPIPIEYQGSEENIRAARDKNIAHLALDPAAQAAINGGNAASYGGNSYSAYAQPGQGNLNNGAYNQFSPYVRSNAQFGGGGGGNRTGGNNNRGGANGANGGGSIQLPDGVDSLTAIDPQNSLLVYANDEGFAKLNTIISYLDRPLRQVEIEAQFVTVHVTDSRLFGIDFSSSKGAFNEQAQGFQPGQGTAFPVGTFTLGFVRNNFQAALSALVSNSRAKIVDSPRVTAINNLTASLNTTASTPVILNSSTSGIGGQVGTTQNLAYITTSIGLTVTPTINGDDTVTVVLQPQVQNQGQDPISGSTAPDISTSTIQTVAIVRDGDTLAIGGLRTKNDSRGGSRIPILSAIPGIGRLFQSVNDSTDEMELIIFVTARIIRHAEDTLPVPGT